ncbi:MAG: D-alanyl-D-alanine carboxypeptidase family protein [Paracoccus sp. (in: a-proteobacteria)]|nr:D-alanyl-D-alanine carboxypeptidase family protein [Paracoccus sp. (in: a-proteobacteria)]
MAANAAPFAAFVMDARTGQQIHAQNADTRLHPASLTKMMTLYMAFTAVERGQVRLDTPFLISNHAANQPPSRLGLRAGQRIELRYLIRAAAVRSSNDAATAIAENLGGSEEQFAAQMTAMARALGMNNTQFRNAHGLTQQGHFSTARDMSIMGRRLFYDFPQYYNIFSRRSADAGIATVQSTNRNFLDNYQGADGIKTGYTRAAGFNLTASAQRGNQRIIATVFGGTSTAQRNAVMGQLLDMGFGRAPQRVNEVRPAPPQYIAEQGSSRRAQAPAAPAPTLASAAPVARPAVTASASTSSNALNDALRSALATAPAERPAAAASTTASTTAAPAAARGLTRSARPLSRPGSAAPQAVATAAPEAQAAPAATNRGGLTVSARPAPRASRATTTAATPAAPTPEASRAETVIDSSAPPQRRSDATMVGPALTLADAAAPAEYVSRVSSSSGRRWGVTLGHYRTRQEADELLLRTAIQESGVLGNANRHIGDTQRGWQASFTAMTRESAHLACERLAARSQSCRVTGP